MRPRTRRSRREIRRGCSEFTLQCVFTPAALFAFVVAIAVSACQREERPATGSGAVSAGTYRMQGTVTKPDIRDHKGIHVYLGGTSYEAYTDDQGKYTIAGVPPGKYKVYAEHSDYQSALVDEVSVAEGFASPATPIQVRPKELELRVSPTEEAERTFSSIYGQAILRGADSSDGILVRVLDSQSRPTDFRTVTNAKGLFQLLRLNPGAYTILFEKPGYQTGRMEVKLDYGDLELRDPIILERAGLSPSAPRSIGGGVTMLDVNGQPLQDNTSTIVYLEGTTTATIPGADGSFRFQNLAPAVYQVAASAPGFALQARAPADVTNQAEARVALTLQATASTTEGAIGSLVGRVAKDDSSDILAGTIVGLVELGQTVMTDASGAYQFANVPAGTYSLLAQSEGYLPGGLEDVVIPPNDEAVATDILLVKRRNFPVVLHTEPAAGDRNVLIREVVPVVVRFNKPMRPETLRAAFRITPPVPFRVFAGREHAMSDFDRLYVELQGVGGREALHFNTQYTVTISREAADYEGLNLPAPFQFGFRTGRASVTGTFPPDGANDVYVDISLYRPVISFNALIDPNSVDRNAIRVRPNPRSTVQASAVENPANGWGQIQLTTMWEPGVRYTVTVNSGVRTSDGSSISNLPYSFTFTTSRGRQIRPTMSRSVRENR